MTFMVRKKYSVKYLSVNKKDNYGRKEIPYNHNLSVSKPSLAPSANLIKTTALYIDSSFTARNQRNQRKCIHFLKCTLRQHLSDIENIS